MEVSNYVAADNLLLSSTFIMHYYRLGLNDNCSQEDLTKRYRKLALQLHPDKYIVKDEAMRSEELYQCTEKMTLLNESYQLLRDPATRHDYDATLRMARRLAYIFLLIRAVGSLFFKILRIYVSYRAFRYLIW